ncbi:MAG: hypothetical protein ACREN2_05425 [Candidatus Dormibacteria bacterium]
MLVIVAASPVKPAAAQTTTPSLAQAPGEELGVLCGSYPPSFTCFSGNQGSVTTNCISGPNGTAILSFTAQGVAIGPYPGTFTESGSYTLGPLGSGGNSMSETVIAFSSTFSIQSASGNISGSKSASGVPQPANTFNFCPVFNLGTFAGAFANYDATITTTSGSFRDTGSALAQVGGPGGAPPGFFEVFSNSNGVVPIPTCNQNSQVNQGQGRNNQGCANPGQQ